MKKANSIAWSTPQQGYAKIEGEKWPAHTGKYRQVYAVSFQGIIPCINSGFVIKQSGICVIQIVLDYAIDENNGCNRSINEIKLLLYTLNEMLGVTVYNPEYLDKPYSILAKCTLIN